PGEDGGCARWRRVRADVGEPSLDFGNAVRIVRGLGFRDEGGALGMRLEHDVDETLRPVRRFLREPPDAPARRQFDVALFGWMVTRDDVEQSRLAGSVAADETHARARRNARGGVFDQRAAGDADGEVVEDEHAGAFWPTRLFDAMPCC